MNLLVDENISRPIAARLLADGHILVLACNVAPGQPDRDVLALALSLNAIVLTEDTDFGDLAMRQHLPSTGVILLRLAGMARNLQPDHVAHMLAAHASSIPGAFTVITPGAVRIRPLP
jgi:predicted nuclease of predicted toxin-antitoxin system